MQNNSKAKKAGALLKSISQCDFCSWSSKGPWCAFIWSSRSHCFSQFVSSMNAKLYTSCKVSCYMQLLQLLLSSARANMEYCSRTPDSGFKTTWIHLGYLGMLHMAVACGSSSFKPWNGPWIHRTLRQSEP